MNSVNYKNSPIYYFNESSDKDGFNYEKIAYDLLKVECKGDGTRNHTIRDGLLFIKAEKMFNYYEIRKARGY